MTQPKSPGPYHPGLSGRDILQGVIDGSVPSVEGLHETLNIRFVDVGDGTARFEGEPSEAHRNPHGTIHGGWYLAMLDGVMGLAIFSKQSPEQMSSTVTFESKIIRPLAMGRTYVAEAAVIHSGRTTAHAEAVMRDAGTQKTVATATSTYAVFARPE